MNFDGIKFTEGSHAENLVVDSGPTFPANPGQSGELFYIDGTGTTKPGLYVNNGVGWIDVGSGSISKLLNNISFIVQQPSAASPGSIALSTLPSGILKNTTGTGQLTTGKIDLTSEVSGYLAASSFPQLSGDVINSAGSTEVSLVPTGIVPGTYMKFTIGKDGRATKAYTLTSADLPPADFIKMINVPNTISGFGIIDAYTKNEIDTKLSTVFGSSVAGFSSLSDVVNQLQIDESTFSNFSNYVQTTKADITYVDTQITTAKNDLYGTSPVNSLKTFQAVAAAINDDPNFSNTITSYVDSQILATKSGNVASATKLQFARNISVTGDVAYTTSFDGSGDVTGVATLANTGVTPGQYTKVTTNSKGLITSGDVLIPSDIPALDWSKITSGKPTTYAGYGITDVAPLSHVSDMSLHLTPAENAWIDAITATSNEVNYLSGVSSNIQTQINGKQPNLGFVPENSANKGIANGYSSLGPDGKIPASQLPSYVDDVMEFNGVANFPTPGETSKIYVDTSTNIIYRWSGSTYIVISPTAGNADSATRLATSRSIGVSGPMTGSALFDGTANITIPLTVTNGSIVLGTATSGNFVSTLSAGTAGAQSGSSGLTISATPSSNGTAASIALSTTGVTAGTYTKVIVDAQGRISAGSNPTTLAGYGITDGLTQNQTITITGDASGSGRTSINLLLADSGVIAGAYGNTTNSPTIVVDSKGRITVAASNPINVPGALGYVPTRSNGDQYSIYPADTRDTVLAPQDRNMGVYFDIKRNTTDGLVDGGTYHGVMTFRQWGTLSDFTGGPARQLAFTDNGNMFIRTGTSATAWGNWQRIMDTTNYAFAANLNQNARTTDAVTFAGITSNGNVTVNGAETVTGNILCNDLTISSDIRFKKNIQPIENVEHKFKAISGISWNTEKDPSRRVGLSAQQVRKQFPEAVFEIDGKLSVAYQNLVGPLVDYVNLVNDKYEAQQEEIDDLHNQIIDLKSTVALLLAKIGE
jgi:phage-related tail fiber protein